MVYKIVSKCLATRLKLTLGEVILKSQSTFVSDRLIHDNATIDFEGLNCMRKNKYGNGHKIMLKLNTVKGYDRIEWCFIVTMLKLGCDIYLG